MMGLVCSYGALGYSYGLDSVVRLGGVPHFFLFIGLAVAFWLLPPVLNLGWGVNWKNRPRVYFLVLCAAAVVADFAFYGGFWGPPLGVVIYVTSIYTLGHLGISFVLASLIGTPGCEMRAIPDLYGKITGHSRKEHHCPGMMDPIDRWEARRQ